MSLYYMCEFELITEIVGHTFISFRQYSALVEDLVAVLLRTNPDDRPSAEQVLCIPALQSYIHQYVQRFSKVRESSVSSPATPTPRRSERDDISKGHSEVNMTPKSDLTGTPKKVQDEVRDYPQSGCDTPTKVTLRPRCDTPVRGPSQSRCDTPVRGPSQSRCDTPVRCSQRPANQTPVYNSSKRTPRIKRPSEDKENVRHFHITNFNCCCVFIFLLYLFF